MFDADVVFHLCGEQTIPNYLGIRAIPSPRHILVVSPETERTTGAIREAIRACGADQTAIQKPNIIIPPYDVPGAAQRLEEAVRPLAHTRLAFNLTGGTKPMFVACQQVAAACGARVSYVDTASHLIRDLSAPFQQHPLPPVFRNVEEFIALAGHAVVDAGRWETNPHRAVRAELSRHLFEHRKTLNETVRRILPHAKAPEHNFREENRDRRWSFTLEDTACRIEIGERSFEFERMTDLARYLTGGWLEEYCYQEFAPLLAKGRLVDLRIGLTASLPHESDKPIQEFDLAFTDGYRLTLAEVKSGAVTQTHIQQLENNVRTFGGILGRGLLLSGFPLFGTAPARIRSSRTLSAVTGWGLQSDLAETSLSLRPGQMTGRAQGRPPRQSTPH